MVSLHENYSLYLSLSSHPTLDAFLHLHTHALLLMPPPWVYTLLYALFPSICQENWAWTLKMSHEMRRDLGISRQVSQFKQIRLPYCQKTHLQQKRKCLSGCRQPDSLRWTLTLDGLSRKGKVTCLWSKRVWELIVFTSRLNDVTLWEANHHFPMWPFSAQPAAAVVSTQTNQI